MEPTTPSARLDAPRLNLISPPRQFFMCGADFAFWLRSAHADARLAKLQEQYPTLEAFDRLYTETPDPWGFLVPAFRYQRLKYMKLLAMLPARPYARALDVGCGLGQFTRMLAPYVDEMVGLELSQVAVEQATAMSANLPHVHFAQGSLEDVGERNLGLFDLVVLTDVVYYVSPLSDETLAGLVSGIANLARTGGLILLANHFFFDLDPQSRHVRHIHAGFGQNSELRLVEEQRHPFFLASLLEKQL